VAQPPRVLGAPLDDHAVRTEPGLEDANTGVQRHDVEGRLAALRLLWARRRNAKVAEAMTSELCPGFQLQGKCVAGGRLEVLEKSKGVPLLRPLALADGQRLLHNVATFAKLPLEAEGLVLLKLLAELGDAGLVRNDEVDEGVVNDRALDFVEPGMARIPAVRVWSRMRFF